MEHFKVPKSTCELTFYSWSEMIEPIDILPEIWVRVSGISENHIGDYLALWTARYMFGKTLKIDMVAYTRKHGVLCTLIGCLNYTKIPQFFPCSLKMGCI